MLTIFRTIRIPVLLVLMLFTAARLSAQQDIGVSVQIGRLPDGHYPTKIYQFNSTPGLVTLTLTNHTQSTRTFYLTGKLTGDNGVLVATPKNYRPPTNIELGPLSTRTLNAIEASYLFDANNLVYISGNTSIKSSVFGEQGLPEGTYQLCVRAIDAGQHVPLSEEDPIGCSNIFTVSTLEPPTILNPYNEAAVFATPVQALPLRWTTPPGAPPLTEYRVRIVEVFGNKNPYDAMLSTATPFFETIVRGAPLFFYSVQQPAMQVGRKYAMMVVASDPMGGGTFRNNGQSEVVWFTYGADNGLTPGNGGDRSGASGPTLEYANHSLSGHLGWTFKKSEAGQTALFTGTGIVNQLYTPGSVTNITNTANTSQSLIKTSTAFAMQASITPLISLNPIAAVNQDQTIQASSKSIFNIINAPAGNAPSLALPTNILSGSGAMLTNCSYQDITIDSATERFNLSGVPVTLRAITNTSSQSTLLATGKTDASGNYTLQFLDPAYQTNNHATRLILSIGVSDFERPEFDVPLSVLSSATADLGNYLLLAKTLRVYPKVVFDSLLTDNNNGYGFHIYRDVRDLTDRPWLANEGMIGGAQRAPILVDGRQVIEVAADSVAPALGTNTAGSKILPVLSRLDAKGAGRIFFGGNLYIKLNPSSPDYNSRTSTVSVVNSPIPSNKVLQGRLEYHLIRKPAAIDGTVYFGMGEQGRVPVQGAIVRMVYKKADRAPGNDPNDLFKLATSAVSSKASVPGASTPTPTPTPAPSWTNQNISDPGITTLQAFAYGIDALGLSSPISINAVTTSGGAGTASSSKLVAQAVLSPSISLPDPNPVPDDSKAVSSTADELGNYHIMLPPLKKGAVITVEVLNMPADFRNFLVDAQGYNNSKATLTMDQGASAHVDFSVKGDVADVVGRVVDEQGKPLANARIDLKGSTLGSTGPDGVFQFRIYPGTHQLTLEKEGYVVKQVSITVPQLTNNGSGSGAGASNGSISAYASKWSAFSLVQKQSETLTRISQTTTVQASVARGNSFSPVMFGIAAAQQSIQGSALAAAFGVSNNAPGSQYESPREFALDLKDIGYLSKIIGKARFRVVEEGSNNPIAGARISIFDSSHVTDEKGEWYYEGFGGSARLTVVPPAGTAYVAQQNLMNLTETGQEQVILIPLKKGIAISGLVSAAGKPLPETRILLDDQDISGVVTDAAGRYIVYTTPGTHTVGARKQGYVGADASAADLSVNKTIDFTLTGGNGKNYSTLLGFAIELDATTPAGAGREKWSGSFVHLQPVDKNVFGISVDMRIPFSNVIVSFDGSGNPVPAGNAVRTDLTEIPIKLFGYLPMRLTGADVVTFTRGSDGKGRLTGVVSIAMSAINGYRGWSLNSDALVTLAKVGGTLVDQIVVFSSDGVQTTDQQYALIGGSGASIGGQLYGFGIGLNKGSIDKDGIHFTGSISTPAVGPVRSISIPIADLSLNRALSVSAATLKTDAIPVLEIASTWKATIQGLIFNEDGFRIGGSLSMTIPQSGTSTINFAELSIAKTGLFGGKFDIPDAGINILNLANLNTDHTPLTFGRIGNSSVYRLAGKANFKINVPILTTELKIPSFEILTNGDFSVTTPADYKTNIGPFQFALTNMTVKSKDATPSIALQGQFKADLSFLKFDIGDITIRPTGSGPVFTVNKVGVKLDVPVVQASVILGFNNDGFEGDGSLSIPGTPIGGTVGFKYYKRPTGIELGAKFFVNLPPIPIGGVVTLEGIGGGFDYKSGGDNGGFSVDVQGKISLLGSGTLVALNPLGIHVASAGILKGYADIVVGTYLKKGHAEVVFNGPDLTFTIQVNVQMSPLEGLVEQTIEGTLLLSAKKDDEFAFLGCATHASLLGLIDNDGEMAIAVNLKNPKTREDLVSHYFSQAPDSYMQQRFSGVYLNVSSHVGISRDDAIGFDLFIVSAKAWFEYGYNASLLLNFQEGAYRIAFGGGFDLGAEACIADIACVGIHAGMCIRVEGGRNDALGWNFMASATGNASLSFGIGFGDCDPGCNEVVTFWDGCIGGAFKVCGNATVDLRFSEKEGIHFGAHAGGQDQTCL